MEIPKKKKILIVLNYFSPYVSGVSEYAKFLAESLANDFEVTVLTGKHDPLLNDREFTGSYWIYRAKPLFFFDKGYISIDYIRKFLTLSRDSDFVNFHFPMLESGLMSLLTKKPIILTYQCDMALTGSLVNKISVLFVRLSGWISLWKAWRVIVLSKDYALNSFMLKRYLSKVVEISPPNRFESFIYEVEEETSSIDDKIIIGFVGRFAREKGLDCLLKAMNNLVNENVYLYLAGDYQNIRGGSIYSEIIHLIEPLEGRVKILGSLSDNDLRNFYMKINILALPSTNKFEAFGMVQLEAMTFGVIPITSNLPGVREVVNKTGIGYLVQPGNIEELTINLIRSINEIRKHDNTRLKISSKIKEKFSNRIFCEKYYEIFN